MEENCRSEYLLYVQLQFSENTHLDSRTRFIKAQNCCNTNDVFDFMNRKIVFHVGVRFRILRRRQLWSWHVIFSLWVFTYPMNQLLKNAVWKITCICILSCDLLTFNIEIVDYFHFKCKIKFRDKLAIEFSWYHL